MASRWRLVASESLSTAAFLLCAARGLLALLGDEGALVALADASVDVLFVAAVVKPERLFTTGGGVIFGLLCSACCICYK
jgi:hypothetical protein